MIVPHFRVENFKLLTPLHVWRDIAVTPHVNVMYLDKPFAFSFDEVSDNDPLDYTPHHYEVPVGFQTDFASIPKVFQSLFSQLDAHIEPAVAHDFLYRTKIVDRHLADQVFLAGMEVVKVPVWKRSTMYAAVRVGAAWAYGSDKDRMVS